MGKDLDSKKMLLSGSVFLEFGAWIFSEQRTRPSWRGLVSYGSVWLDSPRSALPVDVVQGKSMYSVTVTVHRFIHNTWVFGQIFLQPWLRECFKNFKNPRIILHPEKFSSDHKLVDNWQVANLLDPSLSAGQWSKHLCLLLNKCLFTEVLIDYKHLEEKTWLYTMYVYNKKLQIYIHICMTLTYDLIHIYSIHV